MNARALGPPLPPTQAPQLYADSHSFNSRALLTLDDPWPEQLGGQERVSQLNVLRRLRAVPGVFKQLIKRTREAKLFSHRMLGIQPTQG